MPDAPRFRRGRQAPDLNVKQGMVAGPWREQLAGRQRRSRISLDQQNLTRLGAFSTGVGRRADVPWAGLDRLVVTERQAIDEAT